MSERVGILRGTFDPVHVAHLAVATQARHQLMLDRVLLIVAGEPYQKTGERLVSPAAARLAMVRAAVADRDGLEASDAEIRRSGPSYTVETLEGLRVPGRELFLIVGTDLLPELHSWHRWQDIASLATLAVARRPGTQDAVPPTGWRMAEVCIASLALSSSELRAMAAVGRPLEFLVPDAAIAVILEHDLYRSPEEGPPAAHNR